MRIGYACIALAVPESAQKTCTLKNATEERLLWLIGHNLDALDRLIDYNRQNDIRLFRISSDLIPFGSSFAAALTWQEHFADKLTAIGEKIRRAGMRVSMHPGQYTVLNSPDASVAARAVDDLRYHAGVLDGLGLGPEHKLILHLGGVYGDKKQAENRFIQNYLALQPGIKRRLVLENDDKLYHIGDVLGTAARAGIPVVFDNLHNAVNPAEERLTEPEWLRRCAETWRGTDGPQKIHYAQQSMDKKPGAHSVSIRVEPFLDFVRQLPDPDIDIMLEVKDKNVSALKCLNCLSDRGIGALEAEWGRWKYRILERDPETYQAIRQLLRDKSAYPALEMYRRIEAASDLPVTPGGAVNAAQHVWGYFKDRATEGEKKGFQGLLQRFISGETGLQTIKNKLLSLAAKCGEDYLLHSYYFYLADTAPN